MSCRFVIASNGLVERGGGGDEKFACRVRHPMTVCDIEVLTVY